MPLLSAPMPRRKRQRSGTIRLTISKIWSARSTSSGKSASGNLRRTPACVFALMAVRAFPWQRSAATLVAISAVLVAANSSAADDWSSTLSRDPRGSFPDLRPLHGTYAFSWSGITAATADVWFHRGDEGSFVLEGKGRTVGLARVLWRFDVNYRSVAHAQTLRPIELHQTENVRSKRIETNLKFFDAGVTSTRTETNRTKSSSKNFALENLNDLHSALLYLRSQPL